MGQSLSVSTFSVTCVDVHGQIKLVRLDAPSAKDLPQLVQAQGNAFLSYAPLKANGFQNWFDACARAFSKTPTIDAVVFAQDLATLLEAGVTAREAISALNRKAASTSLQSVLNEVNASIANGLALSEALKQTGAFPALMVATVAASEETGDLATGLSRYARFQQNLRQVRDRVIGACVYPLLLMVVGSLVVALLLGVVVPRFATLIDSTNRELPVLSRLLLSWGTFVESHPAVPLLLALVVMGGVAYLASLFNRPEARKRVLDRIPGVAKIAREFQHLQMYRTTAILTARGIAIHKALVFSLEFLSPQDQERLKNALTALQQGVGVSTALAVSGLSDVLAESMLNVAEKTGSMSEMLDRIADYHERSLQRKMDLVAKLIEPILMIIFGVIIGGIVLLMYLPIFDLASSIS